MKLWTFIVTIWSVLLLVDVAEAKTSQPNEYASACTAYLSAGYKWGGKACAGLKKKKLLNCQCKFSEYVETAVNCVDQLMANVSDPSTELPRALKAIHSVCKKASLGSIEAYLSNTTNLKPYSNMSLPFGKRPAKHAFRPSEYEVYNALGASRYNDNFDFTNHRFGGAELAYWCGVILIRSVYYWTARLLPRARQVMDNTVTRHIRRFCTMPALFRQHHSEFIKVFRFITLVFPTREQTLIILGFVGLNIGSVFGLNVWHPNFKYKYKWILAYNTFLGKRSGNMVLFQMPLWFLFAGRNNFLQGLTGWSQDTFIVFHKWLARIAVANTIIHMISYSVVRGVQGRWFEMWHTAYWQWAVVGTVFMFLAVLQATHMFRRLGYEFFLLLHIFAAVFFVIGAYWHLELLKSDFSQYFYATWAVWAFDRACRLGRILVSGPWASAEVTVHDNSVLEFTISYSRLWKPQPGAYAFIHILKPAFWWESHPFTLMPSIRPGEENKLKLFCRVKKGMTRRTLSRALETGGRLNTRLLIDGPYGSHTHNLRHFTECVFIAGGIGITAPFSFIYELITHPSQIHAGNQRITLHWAIAGDDSLAWFDDQLNFMVEHGVNVHVYICGKISEVEPSLNNGEDLSDVVKHNDHHNLGNSCQTIFTPSVTGSTSPEKEISDVNSTGSGGIIKSYTRLRARRIVHEAVDNATGPLCVLCCGPGGLNDDARKGVTEVLTKAHHYVEYFEESFGW